MLEQTSTAATKAEGRSSIPAGTIRKAVEEAFRQAGSAGMTDEQSAKLQAKLGKESTIRARRIELTREGLLVNSGHTRATAAGVKAIVWIHRQWATDRQQMGIEKNNSNIIAVRPCRHCGGNHWREELADAGKIKTSCADCGAFVGYRSQQRGEL